MEHERRKRFVCFLICFVFQAMHYYVRLESVECDMSKRHTQKADECMGLPFKKAISDTDVGLRVSLKAGNKREKETPERRWNLKRGVHKLK